MRGLVPFLVLLPGCMLSGYQDELSEAQSAESAKQQYPVGGFADAEEEPMEDRFGAAGGRAMPRPAPAPEPAPASAGALIIRGSKLKEEAVGDAVAPEPPAPPGGGEQAAVREWFPEAFLWQPDVQTDSDGVAAIDVRVPDQLTTWRVLALAHDRAGHQSGTTHTFDSTLPSYVDPVVPGWMYVGDALQIPIQVVNNANRPTTASLTVRTDGALSGSLASTVSVGAYGSAVRAVPVLAESAGSAEIFTDLSGVDAVRRSWPVHPTGRPVVRQRGGVLTGSRSFELTWPDGTDPRTGRFQVEVHPGPLAVLASELERITAGGRVGGAYAYGVSAHLGTLAAASGVELDAPTIRALKIRAWQRLVRAARAPDAGAASDLLLGLHDAEGGPLLDNLRDRLVRVVVSGQRGDGTWARQDRATLQAVLVQTAVGLKSLPESETGARLRAEGAIERNLPNVDDPYTAAVLLAAGGTSNPDLLRDLVLEGLVDVPNEGRKTVSVPSGVRSAWGVPSKAEMLAWTALALHETHPDEAGDLVAELMTGYSAAGGFGAGRADALALEAVVQALPTIDQPVQLSLKVDGRTVASGAVDPSQPRVPAVLEMAHPGKDAAEIELVAEPAGAGLSFVGTQRAWVPWDGEQGIDGIEVELSQGALRSGREGTFRMTVSAPSGFAVTLVQGLPPGMSVDEDRLKGQAGVTSVEVEQDRFTVTTRAFGAGEVLDLEAKVTPTYAGQMVSRPLEITAGGRTGMAAPHRWTVTP